MFWKKSPESPRRPSGSLRSARQNNHASEHWELLFKEYSDVFAATAELFLDRPCSTGLILTNTEQKLRGKTVPKEFRYTYALRSIALTAFHTRISADSPDGFDPFGCKTVELVNLVAELKRIPQLERATLFFVEVLGYSTRETALLLSVSDAQVKHLLASARTHLLQDPFSIDLIVWLFRQPRITGPAPAQRHSASEPISELAGPFAALTQHVA
jgi:hypothetical protein